MEMISAGGQLRGKADRSQCADEGPAHQRLRWMIERGIILGAVTLQPERRVGTYAPNPGLYIPTQDEKTFALLAHVLGIFSGFIARWYFSW